MADSEAPPAFVGDGCQDDDVPLADSANMQSRKLTAQTPKNVTGGVGVVPHSSEASQGEEKPLLSKLSITTPEGEQSLMVSQSLKKTDLEDAVRRLEWMKVPFAIRTGQNGPTPQWEMVSNFSHLMLVSDIKLNLQIGIAAPWMEELQLSVQRDVEDVCQYVRELLQAYGLWFAFLAVPSPSRPDSYDPVANMPVGQLPLHLIVVLKKELYIWIKSAGRRPTFRRRLHVPETRKLGWIMERLNKWYGWWTWCALWTEHNEGPDGRIPTSILTKDLPEHLLFLEDRMVATTMTVLNKDMTAKHFSLELWQSDSAGKVEQDYEKKVKVKPGHKMRLADGNCTPLSAATLAADFITMRPLKFLHFSEWCTEAGEECPRHPKECRALEPWKGPCWHLRKDGYCDRKFCRACHCKRPTKSRGASRFCSSFGTPALTVVLRN